MSPYTGNNMSPSKKSKQKSLKQACWRAGTNITALCRELGIARQTAYAAYKSPKLFPIAAPKIFNRIRNDNTTP
jgi:transcriptional regulator of acetoin/glycerol metabolism